MEGTSKSMISSEEANMEEDRLSFLPVDIRHHILSLVRTHEAFKTSFLSKMWSAMWPSLPILIFDYRVFPDVDDKLTCFTDFIRHTVARHDESSLKAFMLYLLPTSGCGALIESEWVTFAVEHNARNITLCGLLKNEQKIPDSLFTCRSIVTLELAVSNIVLEWPMAAALPNLKRLVLIDMYLSENCTMDLSSFCPRLETLLMLWCDLSAFTEFSITSSSLKHLKICCFPGFERCEVKLITPSLEKLNYTGGIARGVRRAKCLMFNELFIKFIRDEYPSRLFDKLEVVLLCMWPTRKQLLTTFLLLSRCPKLIQLLSYPSLCLMNQLRVLIVRINLKFLAC